MAPLFNWNALECNEETLNKCRATPMQCMCTQWNMYIYVYIYVFQHDILHHSHWCVFYFPQHARSQSVKMPVHTVHRHMWSTVAWFWTWSNLWGSLDLGDTPWGPVVWFPLSKFSHEAFKTWPAARFLRQSCQCGRWSRKICVYSLHMSTLTIAIAHRNT